MPNFQSMRQREMFVTCYYYAFQLRAQFFREGEAATERAVHFYTKATMLGALLGFHNAFGPHATHYERERE